MKWIAGIFVAVVGAWAKSLVDRAYVEGYTEAMKNVERQQRHFDKQRRGGA